MGWFQSSNSTNIKPDSPTSEQQIVKEEAKVKLESTDELAERPGSQVTSAASTASAHGFASQSTQLPVEMSQPILTGSIKDGEGSSTDGEIDGRKCKKTLRLTSEKLKELNLRPGSNEVQFSVTTAFQGTT